MTEPFAHIVASRRALRELYPQPRDLVLDKVVSEIDVGIATYVARAPFVLIASSATDGTIDVSPRGGDPGFVRVLDERRLAIPDLNGNNRLDTLGNLVENPSVALLFVIPGMGETLRMRGRAYVTTDPTILDLFTGEVRRPTSAIGVQVSAAYVHCAKAVRRGHLWDPSAWPAAEDRPSAAALFKGHVGLEEPVAEIEQQLEAGYARDLAADRPTPT